MDIRRVIFEPEKKTFISRHILLQHWHTYPIALPVRRNPQHRSLLTVVSANFAPGRGSSATFERPWENRFTRQTFLYKYPLHWVLLPTKKKKHNRTLLFGCTLKHGRHFDYWTQPLNMCIRVCYLDCHEAGLCCYLVIYKPITSVTAILLPFVTYLLTLPRTWVCNHRILLRFYNNTFCLKELRYSRTPIMRINYWRR
jgi:hypothetical protein